jgi:alpha-L-fucosidase
MRASQRLYTLSLALELLLPGVAIMAQSPSAPSVGKDPIVLDQEWQEGNSKYDNRRKVILEDVDKTIKEGPYKDNYESLDSYDVPQWYKDAKFGIFIHWGVYSVPAYGNEWYPREMYKEGSDAFKHHIALYGSQNKFGYKDFIPRFKAESFDPQAWAHLFKQSGAKYVVPVFEHHDGFAMYDSSLSDWTVVKMGPHRDTSGELAKAIRAEGMHLGASSHRIEHDFFLGVGRAIPSDVNDPKYAAFYGPAHTWLTGSGDNSALLMDYTFLSQEYMDDWLARSAEIVEKYHPDIMYFDWWIGHPSLRNHLAEFAAFYYDASLKYSNHVGVINYKYAAMRPQSAVLDVERGQLADIHPQYWQTDTSVSNRSWGYIEHDTFKTPEFIVHQLIDIVSKNGNLLLNIGPRSDGTIPEEVQQVLLDVGAWLRVNGDAIYGTQPWIIYGEGPSRVKGGAFNDTSAAEYTAEDFRFTVKDKFLYATEMNWPAKGEAVIRALGSNSGIRIKTATLLGSTSNLQIDQRADGLHIKVGQQAPGKYAYVYRLISSQ